MELVTIAQITLCRAGSASSGGMVQQTDISGVYQIANAQPETLREIVESIAEQYGDTRESLECMSQDLQYDRKHRIVTVFNIQGRNVQYSYPYATLYVFPALKVGDRYFKLEETEPPTSPP